MGFLSKTGLITVLTAFGLSIYLLHQGAVPNFLHLLKTRNELKDRNQSLQWELQDLDKQIKLSKDPSFLERQAVDRLDYAEEHDLVFVFPD